jgi:hypothetical protein
MRHDAYVALIRYGSGIRSLSPRTQLPVSQSYVAGLVQDVHETQESLTQDFSRRVSWSPHAKSSK